MLRSAQNSPGWRWTLLAPTAPVDVPRSGRLGPLFLVASVALHGAVLLTFAGFAPQQPSPLVRSNWMALSVEIEEAVADEAEPTEEVAEVEPEPLPEAKPDPVPRPRPKPVSAQAPAEAEPEPESEPAAGGGIATSSEDGLEVAAAQTGATGVGSGRGAGGTQEGGGLVPRPRPVLPAVDVRALAKKWVRHVNRLLLQRAVRDYPRASRRAHEQGTVLLSIRVDARGRITGLDVSRSSGHSRLDQAAMMAVRAVGAVPAPPSELHWRERALTMPIAYRLQ